MSNLVRIRRALLSVSDKTDLIPFARTLTTHGVQIISTGGTARALTEAGIRVTPIEQITGFPEIMDGRVKTLHPSVHGALLGKRSNPEHLAAMKAHKIEPIDLVCINLYPFERTVSEPGVTMDEAIEQIDVGGPAMIRAAAKNFESVVVITSPRRYDAVANELEQNEGSTTLELRSELAASAFAKVAEYDAAIASFLSRRTPQAFPQVLRLSYTKVDELRYGENPHQAAALYRDPASTGPTIVNSQQLHGKPLSFNNINDAAAALEVVKALRKLTDSNVASIINATFGGAPSANLSGARLLDPGHVGACVVKHTNPCGAAVAPTALQAVDAAIAGDPQAAYGGILAVNAVIDGPAAQRIASPENFFEVIVAPSYDADALDILRKRWTNVRLLAVGDRLASRARKLDYRSVPGGMLVQDRDVRGSTPEQWEHRAGPAPTPALASIGAFLETVCKYIASNAVVLGGLHTHTGPSSQPAASVVRIFGIGSGQVDRVTACRNAIAKAGPNSRGSAAVGDAFFPFSDGPQLLADAGVTFIAHPGGSKRDQDTFDLCNARGISCVTTAVRHFRH